MRIACGSEGTQEPKAGNLYLLICLYTETKVVKLAFGKGNVECADKKFEEKILDVLVVTETRLKGKGEFKFG